MPRKPSPRLLLISIVLLISGLLRFHGLGSQSLWYDETLTLETARLPWAEVVGSVQRLENMPPTYFFAMKVWIRCFGDSDVSLRVPSALAGVGAVVMMYVLTRRLFGREDTAFVAAFLLAISRFHIAYSQEARPYAMAFLLVVASCHALAVLLSGRRRWAEIQYVLSGGAMLWLHPYTVFVLAAQGVWFAIYSIIRRGDARVLSWRQFLILQGAAVLLFGPYVHEMMDIASRGQPWMWKHHPTLLTTFQTYADTTPLLVAYGLAIGAGVVLAIWRGLMIPALLCLTVLLLPVVVPLALSQGKHPFFVPRYSIGALAGFFPLAAYGISALSRRWWMAGAALVFVGLSLPHLKDDYSLGANAQRKQDARSVGADLAALAAAGDVVYCDDFGLLRVMRFYMPASPRMTLTGDPPPAEARPGRLWLISSTVVRSEPDVDPAYAVIATHQHQLVRLDELRLKAQPMAP